MSWNPHVHLGVPSTVLFIWWDEGKGGFNGCIMHATDVSNVVLSVYQWDITAFVVRCWEQHQHPTCSTASILCDAPHAEPDDGLCCLSRNGHGPYTNTAWPCMLASTGKQRTVQLDRCSPFGTEDGWESCTIFSWFVDPPEQHDHDCSPLRCLTQQKKLLDGQTPRS